MWVTGGTQKSPPPELAEAAKGLGVNLIMPEPEVQFFDIHPEAEKGIAMFLQCCRQWRVSDGRRIGLDYGVVLSLLSLEQEPNPREVLKDVQVMEDAALAKLAELES